MDIKLSYEELSNIAEQLKSASESMTQILSDITSQFSLVGDEGVWSGTAASVTKDTFDQLSAKFPEFSDAVMSCYTFLVTTVIPGYQSVDSVITGVSME